MTESMFDPEREPHLGPLLMSYRDTAHESFVPPPAASIAATARQRTRRRMTVVAAAAATLVAVTAAGAVTLTNRTHDRFSPADGPPIPPASPTASATPTPSTAPPSGSPSGSPPAPGTPPSTDNTATTPTAATRTPIRVTINPPSVARGGSVVIGGACLDSYSSPATAQSTAFGKLTLNPMDGGPGARITIGADIPLGKHVVNVRCADGATGTATLTVLDRN